MLTYENAKTQADKVMADNHAEMVQQLGWRIRHKCWHAGDAAAMAIAGDTMNANGRTMADMVADAVGFCYELLINGIMQETNTSDLDGLGKTYAFSVARALGGELFREADRMPTKGHREAMKVRPPVRGHDATGGYRGEADNAPQRVREEMLPHLSHRSLRCDAAGLATSDEIQYGTTGDNENIERLVKRLTVQNCKAAGLDYGKTDCHSARRIIKALLATEGNLTKAAKRLDIDRKTIQRAMPMLQDLLEMAMAVQDRLVKQRVDRKLATGQKTFHAEV
jgi:hypothetical protein